MRYQRPIGVRLGARRARLWGAAALVCAIWLVAPAPMAGQDQTPGTGNDKDDAPKTLPLEPERTIAFTTDEATWLSLTISPDGRTIAFELLGDIYTLPIEGGEAKLISGGLSFDSQPAWSPDGRFITFLSDRTGSENLWIMKPDGSGAAQVSKEARREWASPSWTPDSEYVLVSKARDLFSPYEIWQYHRDGGSGLRVSKAPPATGSAAPAAAISSAPNHMGVVASKNGRYLYYASKNGGFSYNATFPMWQVARLDRETGETETLTGAAGSAVRPVLSPDGSSLVYGTRFDTETGLRIRNLETGDDRWLIHPIQRDDQESRFTRDLLPGYAFTPDGRSVVVTSGGRMQRVDVSTGDASVIPFTARVSQAVGPSLTIEDRVETGPVVVRHVASPALSPDGRRVAFTAVDRLWVMDLPGGEPRRLTTGDAREFMPVWTSDGRSIVYVTWGDAGGHIMRISADGGQPTALTRRAGFYSDPVLSPDGSKIVFLSGPRQARLEGESASLAMRWIPASGGESAMIAPARTGSAPHFAGDGSRIYYTAGGAGLASMRLDGSDRRTHVKITGRGEPEPASASTIMLAPDGKRALAFVNGQIYLVTVPPPGAELLTINVDSPAVPVRKLTDLGGEFMQWSADGAHATWALGAVIFRLPASMAGDAKPEESRVTIELPRHAPEGSVVLRGATVVTMKGHEIVRNADLLVTGNRIAAIGRRGRVGAPSGARVIDVSGKTIIPGFVDVHAHLRLPRLVHDAQIWSYVANLAYGVTTTRDPQTSTTDVFSYGDLVEIGETIGPRIFATGPGVFSATDFKKYEDADAVLKRYKEYFRTNTLKAYLVGDRNQRQWVVQAARKYGIMPTTEGALDLKLNLTHVADGFSGNEHSFPIVPVYKDVVEFVAQSGMFYTPTLLVLYGGPWAENYYYQTTNVHDDAKLRRFVPHSEIDRRAKRRPWVADDEHAFTRHAKVLADIVKAGGRVGMGSHGQLQGLGAHWEIWAMQSGGMSPHDTLRAATIFGAEAIGYSADLGSIEAGKLADLIVLDRDPLSDIRNTNSIRYVMKNGELFQGDTLDQIWPRRKPLEPLYFWDQDPPAKR